MSVRKMNDLIRSFCEGGLEPFEEIPCKYYIRADRECRLLRKGKTARFLKMCRLSTIEMLYETAIRCLKMFQRRYPGLPIDEGEDIDFGGITDRLKKQKLTQGYNLIVWRGYINKVGYNAVRTALFNRGLLPRDRKCGTCKYLPRSRPYFCPKKEEVRKKSDGPCRDYAFEAVIPDPFMDDDDLPDITTPETLLTKKEEEKEDSPLSFIIRLMKERTESAAPESKNREKYERQYDVFASLLHSLSNDVPKATVMKQLAEKYDMDIRTIQRDIRDIREFLRGKNVTIF